MQVQCGHLDTARIADSAKESLSQKAFILYTNIIEGIREVKESSRKVEKVGNMRRAKIGF